MFKKDQNRISRFITMALLFTSFVIGAQNDKINDFQPDELLLFKTIDSTDLHLHVFNPENNHSLKQKPCIVFFFGGGWVAGNPKQFYQQAAYFATLGLMAVCAEYRVEKRNNTSPFESVMDAKSAIRWLRQHASKLGIDPDNIIASGGSAGGHLAACTALIEGNEELGEDLVVSSRPNMMILFNPVLDTTKKGYGIKKVGRERKKDISPVHHIQKINVPTIIFHGTADKTVPFKNATRFTNRMKRKGNTCILESYKDKEHGFFNGTFFRGEKADSLIYDDIIKKSTAFLMTRTTH